MLTHTAHFGFPLEVILVFAVTVVVSLYLDLFAHRRHQAISVKNASIWSAFWIGMALLFYMYLGLRFNWEWAGLYLAGYVLEKSLSVDNLMVFVAIFTSFGIKSELQHRILYWGILGALALRALFVLIGTKLFAASPFVGFLFALFVIWSAIKMLETLGKKNVVIEDYSNHWSVRLTRCFFAIYPKLVGFQFFISHKKLSKEQRHWVTRPAVFYVTPAFLCLIAIEASDLAFAFDSVPAVISVTQEPLLVYAAMIFAILGLRSLYFVLIALTRYLVHLDKAVVVLLFFIGFKMGLQSYNHAIADSGWHISNNVSLMIVLGVLLAGVIVSLIFPGNKEQ